MNKDGGKYGVKTECTVKCLKTYKYSLWLIYCNITFPYNYKQSNLNQVLTVTRVLELTWIWFL